MPDETKPLKVLAALPLLSAEDCGAPFYAAAFGFPRTLEALIARKADIRAGRPQTGGMHALSAAAFEGQLTTVRVLIERGVFSVDERTPVFFFFSWFPVPAIGGGETALHSAARYGHRDVVRYLVSKGAALNARSYNTSTPLDLARRWSNQEMVDLLVELGAQ